jgi:hypothetical protein
MALSRIQNNSYEDTAVHGVRNLIINGAFQCSQRGTSTTGGGFLVDRFELNINNTDNIAITQSQDSSGPSGFANSWKILATTAESVVAADERVRFRQNIEGQNLQQFAFGTSAAKSMTLSFYVKSNKTGTYAVNLEQDDASRVIGSTYTINAANTWEYKTITVIGDTSGTINNDNGVGLVVSWYLLAGSNYTSTDNTSYGASANGKQAYGHSTTWGQGTNDDFYITGIQLELGDTATPFEHRSYGDELARCQRYCTVLTSPSGQFMYRDYYSNDTMVTDAELPVTMRTTPSITMTGSGGTSNTGFTYINLAATPTLAAVNPQAISVFRGVASSARTYIYMASTGELTMEAEL